MGGLPGHRAGHAHRQPHGDGADGRQVAVQQIQCVRIAGGKIVEYREHKPGGFENPFNETITAPAFLQEARAEQGGPIQTREQLENRKRLLNAYSTGTLSAAELAAGLQQTAEAPRCQAVLKETFKRCMNPATEGIYCGIHSRDVDAVHTV